MKCHVLFSLKNNKTIQNIRILSVVIVPSDNVYFQATLNGINSVQKVLQNFRDRGIHHDIVNGYYGILIETFDCDKTFYTCVEVTAGGR